MYNTSVLLAGDSGCKNIGSPFIDNSYKLKLIKKSRLKKVQFSIRISIYSLATHEMDERSNKLIFFFEI